MRVLIIEDEAQLAGHISRALGRRGHAVSVESDGEAGLQSAQANPPDLIVLDLGLPGMDGLEVLRHLRNSLRSVRVLVLTARGEVGHRVRGLHAGADDYLAKPFSMEELVARVEALGRRSPSPDPEDILSVGDLQLDVRNRRVVRAGRQISLSPREYELLSELMREPGRTFSRTELCERIWQREHRYETRTVEIFITRLRRKIDADFNAPLIHTVRTVGYAISESSPLPKAAARAV